VNRWSAMSCSQLLSELHDDLEENQVEFESKQYNVEVELLENTSSTITLS